MEPSGLCETQVPASRGRGDGEVGCEGVRCAPARGKGRSICGIKGVRGPVWWTRWCEGGEAGEDVDVARLYRAHCHSSGRSAEVPAAVAIALSCTEFLPITARTAPNDAPRASRTSQPDASGGGAGFSTVTLSPHVNRCQHVSSRPPALKRTVSEPFSFSSTLWSGWKRNAAASRVALASKRSTTLIRRHHDGARLYAGGSRIRLRFQSKPKVRPLFRPYAMPRV